MPKKPRGQPAPVWKRFMVEAAARLTARKEGWRMGHGDPYEMIGEEIVRFGDGEKFLKSVRRGRATQRQNARYQIMRVVENAIGAAVPRRREDANTPEASKVRLKYRVRYEGTLFSPAPPGGYFISPNEGGAILPLRSVRPPGAD